MAELTADMREAAHDYWEQSYNHPFVQELGQGTLDKDKFQFFLIQDYHYLLEYAKIHAMGVVKAQDYDALGFFAAAQDSILNNELNVHRLYMKEFGISREEADNTPVALSNRMYTGSMEAVALKDDLPAISATLLPCFWTYADYAARLKKDYADVYPTNFYKSWIDTYTDQEYLDSGQWHIEYLNRIDKTLSPKRRDELIQIFVESVQYEYLFWEMSYTKSMEHLPVKRD